MNANKIRAYKLVRKCIDKDVCNAFQGYLNINDHAVRTRNHQHFARTSIIYSYTQMFYLEYMLTFCYIFLFGFRLTGQALITALKLKCFNPV